MSIVRIDTDRLDELTEWCRNKPEKAARRILRAEGARRGEAAGRSKHDTNLSERQRDSFVPIVAGSRVWVQLVGGAYDGKLVIVSHREEAVRLDGLVYLVDSNRYTGMGLPRRAHYLGATIA